MSQKMLDAVDSVINDACQECPMCRESRRTRTICMAEYDGYRCSRAKDHEGDHAACGPLHHPLLTWRKE